MALCAECKPLSYMTAEFNLLQHKLYTEMLSYSCRTPFCLLKQWMCLVSWKRHEGYDNFVCMPFADEFKGSKCTRWAKNVPCCTHAFFNSSCKRHNHCCSQGTLSAQSRSLSLCFLICPFYATLVCGAFKQVQIQPQMGMRSSTRNATFCVIFLIWGCLVGWIMQNECLTMRLAKPILATIAQLALICCP